MKKILFVDNSATNFVNQLGHGIPILPYMGKNPQDQQLYYLKSYLIGIHNQKDLEKVNRKYFRLHKILASKTFEAAKIRLFSKR